MSAFSSKKSTTKSAKKIPFDKELDTTMRNIRTRWPAIADDLEAKWAITSLPLAKMRREATETYNICYDAYQESYAFLRKAEDRNTRIIAEMSVADFQQFIDSIDLNEPIIPLIPHQRFLEDPIPTRGEFFLSDVCINLNDEEVHLLLERGVNPNHNNSYEISVREHENIKVNEPIGMTFQGLESLEEDAEYEEVDINPELQSKGFKIITDLIYHGARFEKDEIKIARAMKFPKKVIDGWNKMHKRTSLWKARRSAIILSKAIPSTYHSHITHYLMDPIMQKEITTYVGDETTSKPKGRRTAKSRGGKQYKGVRQTRRR
jgi:hypothetical protein